MDELVLGGLRVRACGGRDGNGGGAGPAVVLMHGYGAPGTDLVDLHRVLGLSPEVRFLFPEAPIQLPIAPEMAAWGMVESRAWWNIDMLALQRAMQQGEMRNLRTEYPDGMDDARNQVVSMLEEATGLLGIPGGGLVLGGFSQGAMLAMDTALQSKVDVAGVVLMSGTLLCEDVWTPLMESRAGTPVFQSHGRQDPVLPFPLAEELGNKLQSQGWDHTWVPFDGAHGIPGPVLQELQRFLLPLLSPKVL